MERKPTYEELEKRIQELERTEDEFKRTEEALSESEAHLRTVIYTIPDLVWLKDPDGVYLSCNSKFERFFGAKETDIVGKTDYNFVDKELADFFREKDKLAMVAGMPSTNEEEITFADDSHREIVETVKTPMYNFDGKLLGVLGIARDITKRKQAETEKIKAQKVAGEQKKLALVGKIAGKISHDFNNILAIILSTAEITLEESNDVEINKALKIIIEETFRGVNLTRNLVVFAKDYEPKQAYFILEDKINLVLNLLAKDLEEIELIKEYEINMPELLADPGMIENSLINLIQNSIHALGMITNPKIIIRSFYMDGKICLEIQDNGCGIPKEHLRDIYEPSFTLKGSKDVTRSYKNGVKGTGYGITNVKKFIMQHKGSMSVESEFGWGTKISLDLPVIKKELTPEEKKEILTPTAQFEKSILLVEDEQSLSDVQYRVLTDKPLNHRVDIANNGQAAMDLFDRNEYDFVSMDYVLPGSINGLDVYNHIRETNKAVPILFFSGNIEFLESVKKLKQKDPILDLLSKPCQHKDYVNGINKLLGKIFAEQSYRM